ncbi:MAG: hypothetical protein J6U87_04765, partial [Clostridia bacterium]|nr:hypothetical protein [Clostridia bacterium]
AGIAASLGAMSEYLLLCAALRRRGVRAYPVQLTLFTVCYTLASAVFYKGSAWGSLFVLAAVGGVFLLVNRRLFWGLWQKLLGRE